MSKRDDIRKIWQESFKDSREYVKMYFDQVYRDEDALLLQNEEGLPVSSLLLQRYAMTFHGALPTVSYIAGAATRRNQRGKGYMSRLMVDALEASAARGDMLCSLIPANEALYYFYRRYGFSTVFYTKEQRFTALHPFPVHGEYHHLDDTITDEVWEAFNRFQMERRCYIIHSQRDFYNILADLQMDGGDFVVMARDDEDHGHEIVSMAWARMSDDVLLVTDVMGESEDARAAALRQLRGMHGDTPFLLYGRPTDTMGGRLMPRGMGRVVNAGKALEIIAGAYPRFAAKIKVTDKLLPAYNSHTYIVDGGTCMIDDGYRGRLDFDVTVDVFTDILFSSPVTGDILRFPSERPMISLMLD